MAAGRSRQHAWPLDTGRRANRSRGSRNRAALFQANKFSETINMQQLTVSEGNGLPMPPGVTAITDLKNQKRASKTLSKAVGLHLEGKLEPAARLLTKALEDGERD